MDLTYTWYGSSSPCLGLLPSSRCLCLDILLCHTCDKVRHNDIKCLCLDDITYVTLCDMLPLPHNRSEEAKGMCANCVRYGVPCMMIRMRPHDQFGTATPPPSERGGLSFKFQIVSRAVEKFEKPLPPSRESFLSLFGHSRRAEVVLEI